MRFLIIVFLFFSAACAAQDWHSLSSKGKTLYEAGDYPQAKKIDQQALDLAEALHGKESIQYRTSLNNLGYIYRTTGHYDSAIVLFQQYLSLAASSDNTDSLELADILDEIANTYLESGQYDSTEHYLFKAQNLLPDSISTETGFETKIKVHNTFASLYSKRGQTEKAKELMETQLSSIQQYYDQDYAHRTLYHTTLSNLSSYYTQLNYVDSAKRCALEYYSLVDPNTSDQKDYLFALEKLGNVYRKANQLDSAIFYWDKVLDGIKEGRLAESNLHISTLSNLGEAYSAMEEYPKSIHVLEKSIHLQEQHAGQNPRIYQPTLFNLAEAYHWSKQYQKAYAVYVQLMQEVEHEILHHFTYLSESEKTAFFREQHLYFESFANFVILEITDLPLFQKPDTAYTNTEGLGLLYQLRMVTKGLILHSSTQLKAKLQQTKDTNLIAQHTQWEAVKSALAQTYASNTTDKNRISQLEKRREAIEKSLIRQSLSFEESYAIKQHNWTEIRESLAPGEAAIEMIRIADGLAYVALIITSETTDHPEAALVLSRKSKTLEGQLFHSYFNAIQYRLEDTVSYAYYWKPIKEQLDALIPPKKRKTIYFSADGIYHQLNLNTLYNPTTNQYLIQEEDIRYCTNTKTVLPYQRNPSSATKEATLIGNPDFSQFPKPYAPLPGSEQEIKRISQKLSSSGWKTTILIGAEATEKRVKSIRSPEILHIATHGFFDHKKNYTSLVEDMLQSGLVFSKSNTEQDGILTAFEASALSLENTSLVVLSACETGLGEYHPGEDIYGLQRGFLSAGAKNLMMSLWKVDDQATSDLMDIFYTRYLSQNHPSKALREAQLRMIKKYPEPYYWGPFLSIQD